MPGSSAHAGTEQVGKNMGRKGNTADYAEELKKDYECWFTRWKEGWSDPGYPDGTGINGARGRIEYDKKELEKAGGEMPEEYFRPLPPEVPESYMARPKALWYVGIQRYRQYLADENYQYLCQVRDSLSRETIKHSSIDNVIGYAKGLKYALEHKDFLTLRRHFKYPEMYMESFRDCRMRIGEMLLKEEEQKHVPVEEKGGQMSLFEIGIPHMHR